MSSSFLAATRVRRADTLVRLAGYARCEGPIALFQPSQRTSRKLQNERMIAWKEASPTARLLLENEDFMRAFHQIAQRLTEAGLDLDDLRAASWSLLAKIGMVPKSIEDYAAEGVWPLSREHAEQGCIALAEIPMQPRNLHIAVAYYRLWRGEEGGPDYLGYVCGPRSSSAWRDDNLFVRLTATSWATAEAEYPWDVAHLDDRAEDDGSDEEEMRDWEELLGEYARDAVEGWVEYDEELEGFSISPPPGEEFNYVYRDGAKTKPIRWHCSEAQAGLPDVAADIESLTEHWDFDVDDFSHVAHGEHV